MLQICYIVVFLLVCALAPTCAHACACTSTLTSAYTRTNKLQAGSCELEAASCKIEGGIPMSKLLNNIRISDLPGYVKSSSFRQRTPELNCYWDSDARRSFPFILAITGNIATAETFPYNRKEYRRTGHCYKFLRRANYRDGEFRGWHQLSFTFEILEKVATGEQVAILREVVRGGETY